MAKDEWRFLMTNPEFQLHGRRGPKKNEQPTVLVKESASYLLITSHGFIGSHLRAGGLQRVRAVVFLASLYNPSKLFPVFVWTTNQINSNERVSRACSSNPRRLLLAAARPLT